MVIKYLQPYDRKSRIYNTSGREYLIFSLQGCFSKKKKVDSVDTEAEVSRDFFF